MQLCLIYMVRLSSVVLSKVLFILTGSSSNMCSPVYTQLIETKLKGTHQRILLLLYTDGIQPFMWNSLIREKHVYRVHTQFILMSFLSFNSFIPVFFGTFYIENASSQLCKTAVVGKERERRRKSIVCQNWKRKWWSWKMQIHEPASIQFICARCTWSRLSLSWFFVPSLDTNGIVCHAFEMRNVPSNLLANPRETRSKRHG